MLEKLIIQSSNTAALKLSRLKILPQNPYLFEVNPSCVHPAFVAFLHINCNFLPINLQT